MKTTKFIKEVEAIGFDVKQEDYVLKIYNMYSSSLVAKIDEENTFSMDTFFVGFDYLQDARQHQLFTILTEYASTPIKERQEKKYMYLLKCFSENEKNCLYLTYDRHNEFFTLDYQDTDMQLTFKENDPLLKIVNLDIFEKIEVEE